MRAYKSLVLAAVAAMVTSAAQAVPSLQFVDNGDSSVTLQIDVDATGSTASEIAVEIVTSGIDLTSATIVDPLFDIATPGDNPFTGGVTSGVWLGLPDQVFVSYGSAVLTPGVYDFLRLGFDGAGTITAAGLVAQLGVNNTGLSASITVVPEPTATLLCAAALATAVFRRRR